LFKEKRKYKEEAKLLLLGPGESGKSTIFKQMKVIENNNNNGGYSVDELHGYKYIVFANCITQMKAVVIAAKKLEIAIEDQNKEAAETIAALPTGGDSWTQEVGGLVKQLWQDKGIQQTYNQKDKCYQLNDSAKYFFENLDRFLAPDYVPSIGDVLRARVRTTGIEEAEFLIEDFSFRMLDVGGQRSERRKWIHCFDCVTAVIFCVALSEYDQTLREDDAQNRMHESLALFDEVCNSSYFGKTDFILFLNKTDLFKEKIEKVDLSVCFENYTGGLNFENASNFIKARFVEKNRCPHVIYVHFTCAISTENIEFVFKAVRETIIKKILGQVIVL